MIMHMHSVRGGTLYHKYCAKLLQGWGCDYIQGRLTGLASLTKPWAANTAAQPKGAMPEAEVVAN